MEQARAYDAAGADELMFLDITASHEGRGAILDVIARTADVCFMPLGVGGGVRTVEDARRILRAGRGQGVDQYRRGGEPRADRRGGRRLGAQAVVLAIDAKRALDRDGWEVFTYGGRKGTGMDVAAWAVRGVALGAGEILLTSMDRDGAKSGYDVSLLRAVSDAVSVPVIASGGAGWPGIWWRRCARAARTRCWPRRSSTSARSAWARPSRPCWTRASRCA